MALPHSGRTTNRAGDAAPLGSAPYRSPAAARPCRAVTRALRPFLQRVSTRPETRAVKTLGWYYLLLGVDPGRWPLALRLQASSLPIPLHDCSETAHDVYVVQAIRDSSRPA